MHFSSDVWSKLAKTRVFDMVITRLLHSYLMHLGETMGVAERNALHGFLTLTNG